MTRRSIRARLRRSKLYTFACIHPHAGEREEPHQFQGPGFSRIVYCNEPDRHIKYCSNYISTTKYNIVTFLPKAIFEQFRRVANLYLLLTAFLSFAQVGASSQVTNVAPLAFTIGCSILKEAWEDWRRFIQDVKVNMRKARVHKGDGVFGPKPWKKLRVGDVVKVEKDKFFPADLLFVSSSYEDGICYVETTNIDGETNLKVKRALEVTLPLGDDITFKNFTGKISCEDPNPNLDTFVGNLKYDRQVYPLDPSQILLRDSKLRNTAYVFGVVIFTGHDSKVMQNGTSSPSKRSKMEKQMEKIIYVLFSLLVLISLISSIGFVMKTKLQMPRWWYMQPYNKSKMYDPNEPLKSSFPHWFTALMMYEVLIPFSLYISIEVVKVLQAMFINKDIHMYDENTKTHAQARTSNLNEELGRVEIILSDKTGTLTCNQMDFLKCSIAGVAYGTRSSEVELVATREMALNLDGQDSELAYQNGVNVSEIDVESTVVTCKEEKYQKPPIKGFSFEDSRLMDENWLKEPNADVILLFFRILALCHTAFPKENVETGEITYEVESPDEGAFLVASREFGFEFCKRTQSSVFVNERFLSSKDSIQREYKILNLLDFTSKRKRMSVIAQDEDGQLLLLCKGADSIIFGRLSKNGRMYEEATTKHLVDYGEAGLRTLALAYRKLEKIEYSAWSKEFIKAKTSIGGDREVVLERLSDTIERNLILVGATAVEDKLQKGVPQCIDKLAQAGLKIWVLTGDKFETAINIGFSCNLLRRDMKQICITAMNIETYAQDSRKAVKDNIMMQITNASQMIKLENDPHSAFALIIDGETLTYALEDDLKHQFLNLAIYCASVVCCRVSPKQKALVTRLVKQGTGKMTLAIGDGANDVGMIQEADIGIGISGVEGMQAVMASDFAIAQFRFLERLLIVHGHWCYKRIAQMICHFIYKNTAFGLTLFYFEAFAGFSGQLIYDSTYMVLFNVLTSLPVISLGVFEQDVSAEICLQFPALYQQGQKNLFFNWYRIFGWIGNGLYCSIMLFFVNIIVFYVQPFRSEGQTADISIVGTTMFTCIIWVVNCQIALTTTHFTWPQYIFILGSITTGYLFLLIYGMVSPVYSNNAYQLLVEALAPTPMYWCANLLVTIICNLPYLARMSFQRCFHPMDHHIIQEMKYYKKYVNDFSGNESKPCRLALGSVNNIVAQGTMFWKSGPNEVLHSTPLGEGNMRVSIDVVKVSNAILPIPIPGEATTIGEAVGCHVAWPKNLIYFAPEVTSKKPARIGNERALKHHGVVGHGVVADEATSKDVEWEKNLETIGLFAIFVKNTSKEDAMIIPLEKDIFGDEVEAHLQKVDMEYVCQMKEVSGTCIMLYIRQLYRGIKASNMDRRFVFVNPCLLSGRMVAEELKSRLLAKRLEEVKEDQLLFVPCNFGFHWVLCIIDLYSESSPIVYLMDSINKDFSLSLKIMINTAFSIYDKAKGRRIRVIPVLKVVECPKQPTNVECGFYVMKYMKDVIKEERILRSGNFKGKRTYTQAEIDEVRVEWINSIVN